MRQPLSASVRAALDAQPFTDLTLNVPEATLAATEIVITGVPCPDTMVTPAGATQL